MKQPVTTLSGLVQLSYLILWKIKCCDASTDSWTLANCKWLLRCCESRIPYSWILFRALLSDHHNTIIDFVGHDGTTVCQFFTTLHAKASQSVPTNHIQIHYYSPPPPHTPSWTVILQGCKVIWSVFGWDFKYIRCPCQLCSVGT